MAQTWDKETDVVVVGTGATGLAAAISAAADGCSVLMLESQPKWGGSTTLSGGGLWMPTNPLMARLHLEDSTDKALAYMDEVIADVGPASSPERRRAFVETVPEVFRFLAGLGVIWQAAPDYPDYYPDREGGMVGRAIEVKPFNVKKLGDWRTTSRFDEGMPLPAKTDDVWLIARAWSSWRGFGRTMKVAGRTIGGVVTGKSLAGTGSALTGALLDIALRQGTTVLLSTPLIDLVPSDDGRGVLGAVARTPAGDAIRIRARRGVILGAGGFARNKEWRMKYHGISGFTSAAEGDDGSAIAIGEAAGGALAMMDDAWWGASFVQPQDHYGFSVWERSMPFSIMVDSSGARFTNESASYIDVGHDILARDKTVRAIPCWLVADAHHGRRYLNSAVLAGLKKMQAIGAIKKAPTLAALAAETGVDAAGLAATVERFNSLAKSGVDTDFDRGRTIYDNYYGDPRVKPNSNLAPLTKGPYTAYQMVPGDLGTKGGLLTDADARVLTADGDAIDGLYAAGNTTASVMGRTYPGPGSTIGPAVVFGYRAGRHAARRDVD